MVRDSVLTDRETEILRMWEAGSTLNQIGRRLGVSRERIRQILKVLRARGHTVISKADRSTQRRKHKLDVVLAHEKEILSMISEGASVSAIATKLGLVQEHTKLAIKQLFAAGKSIGTNYSPTDTTLTVWKIIRRKLNEGATLQEIANKLGLSKIAIVRHIRLMRESKLIPPATQGPQPNEALQIHRETIVREMLADGAKRQEIAARLGISVGTLARVIAHMRIRQERKPEN